MDATGGRYEFRVFAQNFGLAEEIVYRYDTTGRRQSREVYVLSAGCERKNIKLRNGLLDIKLLVRCERKLEQWRPQAKHAFPLPRQIIQDEIFPALAITAPDLKQPAY